jgi:hypothetical protein
MAEEMRDPVWTVYLWDGGFYHVVAKTHAEAYRIMFAQRPVPRIKFIVRDVEGSES